MTTSTIHIAVLFLTLIISCSVNTEKPGKIAGPDRQCVCFQLRHRLERGFYLQYLEGEDSLYTGMCKITRENGNEITYKYLKGHILEIIEYYPGKLLHEEMIYDTTGLTIKRVRYKRINDLLTTI